MIRRSIAPRIQEALDDTPVVFLRGARQTGKTTLARALARERGGAFLTLDDAGTLAAALDDPQAFVAGLGRFAVLDEIQRAPELLPAIKMTVDRDRRPGRLLLTGSADLLALPRVSESLAGRMEVLTLHSFSQGELGGWREGFVDACFARSFRPLAPPREVDVAGAILRGGFPEVQGRGSRRRAAWFDAYLETMLLRDVLDLGDVAHAPRLPRLAALLAARCAQTLDVSGVARAAALPRSTVDRYLRLLELGFLFRRVPAWSANLSKRLVRAPKVLLEDVGLAAHLRGVAERRTLGRDALGPLLENLVGMELQKQLSWARTAAVLHHFRTHTQREVDFVLEDRRGRLVGIEVKAAATLRSTDFAGLRSLAELAGRRFHRGVLLYRGTESVPIGPRSLAVPVETLWLAGPGA